MKRFSIILLALLATISMMAETETVTLDFTDGTLSFNGDNLAGFTSSNISVVKTGGTKIYSNTLRLYNGNSNNGDGEITINALNSYNIVDLTVSVTENQYSTGLTVNQSSLKWTSSDGIAWDGYKKIGSNKANLVWTMYENTGSKITYTKITKIVITLEKEASTAEESLTLAQLVTKGNAGETDASTLYTITSPLEVVTVITDANGKKYLLAKDANGDAVGAVTKSAEWADYTMNYTANFTDDETASLVQNKKLQSDYDQSNWIEIALPDGFNNGGNDYGSEAWSTGNVAGTILTASCVKGYLSDAKNPRLSLKSDAVLATSKSATTAYSRNIYCPANFVTTPGVASSQTSAYNDNSYFFMSPKPCEYAHVIWAIYQDGTFVLPDKSADGNTNLHGFTGSFTCAYDYNGNNSVDGINNGDMCTFKAVVKVKTSNGDAAPRKAAGTSSSNYVVYPINLSASSIVTSAEVVKTNKTVSGIRYFNLQGMSSNEPFEGVNLVLKQYTDGTTSTEKMLK